MCTALRELTATSENFTAADRKLPENNVFSGSQSETEGQFACSYSCCKCVLAILTFLDVIFHVLKGTAAELYNSFTYHNQHVPLTLLFQAVWLLALRKIPELKTLLLRLPY